MKVILANRLGYCFGVRKAIDAAMAQASGETCILGEIIHNGAVVETLKKRGVKTVQTIEEIDTPNVIIRSHGVGKRVYGDIAARGAHIIDCTCPFVKKIHELVAAHYADGYRIVIAGKAEHAEVVGINGNCENTALIVSKPQDCAAIDFSEKICLVAQTTFHADIYRKIIDFIVNLECKTLEIFDTICYTTIERQNEVKTLAARCDKMLILGSHTSSNTNQLFQISQSLCKDSYLISGIEQLSTIVFSEEDCVGITSGASTHDELIQEVVQFMSENNEVQMNADVETQDFGDLLKQQENESVVEYKKGARIKDAEIIEVRDDGIVVIIGGKNDGFVSKDEAVYEGDYKPMDFSVGSKIGVVITGSKDKDSGLIPVSKKQYDAIQIGNEIINTIRNNEEFSLKITKALEKGLIGYLGNYRVFVPQSHVEERFVKNLQPYEGRTLRLRAIEIDDEKQKIVASQKAVLSEERISKEKEFFDNIFPEAVVIGKVMRVTPFGAFVNVGGFDCLAHITDLSWTKIGKVEDVLTIGQEYEFIVLKIDREKARVSLGYKQLHLHPFEEYVTKHNVGEKVEGKVVRIAPFGAFVEIATGVDGLVHISEASHEFVKNINDVLKVGDEVNAIITKIDDLNRKISLSVKAASDTPADGERSDGDSPRGDRKSRSERFEEKLEGRQDRRPRGDRHDDATKGWSEQASNNPFADLLKGMSSEDEDKE